MQQHGPWQILRSHQIYKDAWLDVRKDDVIRPDGAAGTHGVVVLAPGVSVLALDQANRVYLTDEFHYAVGRRTLEVVSGGGGPRGGPPRGGPPGPAGKRGGEPGGWAESGS